MTQYEFSEEQKRVIQRIQESTTFTEAEDIARELYTPEHIPESGTLRIYINRKLDISPNKRAAHAVHAALTAFGVHPRTKVVVLDKGPTVIETMRVAIHDAGYTELEPGTLTAGTNWPEDSEERSGV